MQCSYCGGKNPEGFTFCGHCGTPLPRICTRCGADISRGSIVCDRCGADLSGYQMSNLGGERRFVVVLFADIVDFTRLSENLDPEQVTRLANRCLDCMGQAVARHGGHVEKYTGDGLVGVFGAPVSHEDDPVRALEAAMAMQEEIGELDLALPVPRLALHIGAACGPVVAARVGSREWKEYTVIGTAVNLASRLEALSGGGQILVSGSLRRLIAHRFVFDRVVLDDEVGLDGVEVFELVGERSEIEAGVWKASQG